MSSKKIYTSVGLEEWIVKALDDDSARQQRSRSNLLEMILREHYKSKEGSAKGESNGHEA